MTSTGLHPRISINLMSTMTWPIRQDISFLDEIDARVISVPQSKLGAAPRHTIEAIRAAGLRVASLGAGGFSLVDGPQEALDTLRPLIDAAADLSCPVLFFPTGPTPTRTPTDQACSRFIEALGLARAYARDRGVTLAIENCSVANRRVGFIHSFADAGELAREADIGVALEVQNCWYERHLAARLREFLERIVIVQVSDHMTGEQLLMNRRVPGDGSMPLEWTLACLLDAGYEGLFDIEILGPTIEAEGYAAAVGRSIDWLSERLTAWGV